MISPINNIIFTALSMGSNKLREHLHLTTPELKEHATARNAAYVALATGGITAVMINPVTRVALCTFLSMSATMTTILLNLTLVGLYVGWMMAKGIGSLASNGLAGGTGILSILKNLFGSTSTSLLESPQGEVRSITGQELPKFEEENLPEEFAKLPNKTADNAPSTPKLVEEFESFTAQKAPEKGNQGKNEEVGSQTTAQLLKDFAKCSEPSRVQSRLNSLERHLQPEKLVEEFEEFRRKKSEEQNHLVQEFLKPQNEGVTYASIRRKDVNTVSNKPSTPDLDSLMRNWKQFNIRSKL